MILVYSHSKSFFLSITLFSFYYNRIKLLCLRFYSLYLLKQNVFQYWIFPLLPHIYTIHIYIVDSHTYFKLTPRIRIWMYKRILFAAHSARSSTYIGIDDVRFTLCRRLNRERVREREQTHIGYREEHEIKCINLGEYQVNIQQANMYRYMVREYIYICQAATNSISDICIRSHHTEGLLGLKFASKCDVSCEQLWCLRIIIPYIRTYIVQQEQTRELSQSYTYTA